MEMAICSIYDSKAEAWMNPMFFQSTAQGIRSFTDAVNNAESDFYRHPEDYTLFWLGNFNQRTGEIVVNDAPHSLVTGISVKESV